MIRFVLTIVLLIPMNQLVAQEANPPDPAAAASPASSSKSGTKRALIVCGLTGGGERHKAFADNLTKIHTALTTKLGFAAADVEVLFGDEPADADVDPVKSSARATKEEIERRAQALRDKTRAEDELWVVVLGHTHYDGQKSWLNLPGPDLHHVDFGKLFASLPAHQQVFVMTTSTSGFYLKPLSAKNRVIITATEADWETNETEFPAEFAQVLLSPPPAKELDIDADEKITLFDVYITVARNLAKSYRERELLATEHSLLDDNGDGRGTELQIDFLSPEFGGRASPTKPTIPTIGPTADGFLSKSIQLQIGE